MPTLAHNCPHCGARNAAFQLHTIQRRGTLFLWNAFASCPVCIDPVSLVIASPQDPKQLDGDIRNREGTILVNFFPKQELSKSPLDVPEASARAFIEGSDSLKDGRATAAIAMFRRTIDVATKQYSDEVHAWNLEKRIDKLAAAGLITKDLQAWAHKIRLEGNGALHELDEPTIEQAQELKMFAELMLTYLFTLPARIKANLSED